MLTREVLGSAEALPDAKTLDTFLGCEQGSTASGFNNNFS